MFDNAVREKNVQGKASDSRVALDRVWVAGDAGGLGLRAAALEECVAVGVAVLGGPDVGVEGVGGRADGQLLRPHRLGCTRVQNHNVLGSQCTSFKMITRYAHYRHDGTL